MQRSIQLSIFAVLALILVSSVSALTFDFRVKAINDTVFIDEQAVFLITVFNQDTSPATFEIVPDPINWVSTVDPQLLEIPSFGSRNAFIYAKPKSTLQPGSHAIPIKVTETEQEKSVTKNVPVYLKALDGSGRYMPSVALGMDVPEKIDPRYHVKVSIYLRNRNQLNITSLDMKIASDGLFEKQFTRSLDPLMEDREEYIFELDDLQAPGIYTVVVEITSLGKSISKVEKTFEIIGYTLPKEDVQITRGIFKTITTYTISNTGNAPLDYTITIPDKILQGMFGTYGGTYLQAPAHERVNGERVLAWHPTILSQGTETVIVTHNYQLAVAIIVFIIIVLITYLSTRSPISLVKEAKEELHEGQHVVKVRVLIRNRSNKPRYKINVKDRVPPLAVVIKRAHIGTLQPTSVRPDRKQGTILTWELDVLEPHEERLVAYIIQTRLKVLGGFTLRPAKVSFQYGSREKQARSNTVIVRHQ
jgi:hypothetical protein